MIDVGHFIYFWSGVLRYEAGEGKKTWMHITSGAMLIDKI